MTSSVKGFLSMGPRSAAAWGFIALAAAFASASPAAGVMGTEDRLHTQLEESRPAEGETLTDSPTEVWLRFSTAVQRGLSTIVLTGADGSVVPLAELVSVSGSEDMQLSAVLPTDLTTGSYTVAWTTAGPDSHIIEGSFDFTVELPEPPQEETPPDLDSATVVEQSGAAAAGAGLEQAGGTESTPAQSGGEFAEAIAPLGLIARWFGFLGSILLVGIAAFHLVVVGAAKRRGEAEAVADFLPRLRGYAFVVATFALVAALLRLGDGVASFGVGRIGPLLFASPWGLAWWLYLVGAIAAFVGVRISGRSGTRATGWRLLALGALLTAVSMPFAGHGWSAPTRLISAPAHALHTIGAGLWMGSLGVLVLVALPFLAKRRDAEGRSPEASAWVASFSRLALIGVGVLLVSGGINTWQHVGSPAALFGTMYGRTLLVKIGVLGAALLLGLYNWKQARPALDETGRPGLIRLPATVELVLGFGVLVVTAVLVAMHLPNI